MLQSHPHSGHRWIIGVILTAISLNIVAVALHYLARGSDGLLRELIALLVLLIACVAVYLGDSFSRWFLCAGLAIRGLTGLYIGLLAASGSVALYGLTTGVLHLICAGILALIPSVGAYFVSEG
jgi:hypothetical protein